MLEKKQIQLNCCNFWINNAIWSPLKIKNLPDIPNKFYHNMEDNNFNHFAIMTLSKKVRLTNGENQKQTNFFCGSILAPF